MLQGAFARFGSFRQGLENFNKSDKKWLLESGSEAEVFGVGLTSTIALGYSKLANENGVSIIQQALTDLSPVIERFSEGFASNPVITSVGAAYCVGLAALFTFSARAVTKANSQRHRLMNDWDQQLNDCGVPFKENAWFRPSAYAKANFLMAKVSAAFSGACLAGLDYSDGNNAYLLAGGAALGGVNAVRDCNKGQDNFRNLRALAMANA